MRGGSFLPCCPGPPHIQPPQAPTRWSVRSPRPLRPRRVPTSPVRLFDERLHALVGALKVIEELLLLNREVRKLGALLETPDFSGGLLEERHRTVQALPDEFKMVVLLSDIEGLQYKEIAAILSCPIGTVRSRLSRGRCLLKRQLWAYAQDHGFVDKDAVL